MTNTLTYIGTLTVTTCWCGIGHALPSDLYERAQRDHSFSVYCPLGHAWVVTGQTEAQKLTRLLQQERDTSASLRADRDQVKASLNATKGVVTRMRRRAIAGTCAFCHRHFTNMERHVAAKHPGEQP